MNNIEQILSKVVYEGLKLTSKQAEILFGINSSEEVELIRKYADILRNNIAGDKVSYIVNLNVNFTNICESVCLFCGFRRNEGDPEAYILDLERFEEQLAHAAKEGISEICFQGGLYSRLKIRGLEQNNLLDNYTGLLNFVKSRYPEIHIHAYSPEEIDFLSILTGRSNRYILEYFKDSGLDSMPGTAAEILSDDIRKKICPKKLNTNKWVEIIKLAHNLDIPTTATIMYGHVEQNYHRAAHLETLRNIQEETGGFTEFIPLPFISSRTLLSGKVAPLISVDRLKMLAISRLFFREMIPNIQASWVKQGVDETAESLDWGVNDIGGTLGDERITFEAGGGFGKNMRKEQLIEIITSKNRIPVLRDTLYNHCKEFVAV